jgi:hypothetical protein
MNTQREFLHIPDGETASIILKYNTGLLRNGQFGKYFIYTVIHDSKEKLLKVTERLEKQFRKQDLQGGQEITLRKDLVSPKEGEPYSVINLVTDNGESIPASTSLLTDNQLQLPSNGGELSEELQLLSRSMQDARIICKDLNDSDFISGMTLTVGLFLARTIKANLNARSINHRRAFPRRTSKPANEPDQQPVAATEKKDDDLPF